MALSACPTEWATKGGALGHIRPSARNSAPRQVLFLALSLLNLYTHSPCALQACVVGSSMDDGGDEAAVDAGAPASPSTGPASTPIDPTPAVSGALVSPDSQNNNCADPTEPRSDSLHNKFGGRSIGCVRAQICASSLSIAHTHTHTSLCSGRKSAGVRQRGNIVAVGK